jgi:hypothetical protein
VAFARLKSWFNPKAARELARRNALAALHEVADYAAHRAILYAPVDTGFMVSHIRVEELAGGLGFRVVSTAFYSAYVHQRIPFLAMGLADAAAVWPAFARAQASTLGGVHNPEGFLSSTFTT